MIVSVGTAGADADSTVNSPTWTQRTRQLLEHFERTTPFVDRVDRSVTMALDAHSKLRSNRPNTPASTGHEE